MLVLFVASGIVNDLFCLSPFQVAVGFAFKEWIPEVVETDYHYLARRFLTVQFDAFFLFAHILARPPCAAAVLLCVLGGQQEPFEGGDGHVLRFVAHGSIPILNEAWPQACS